MSELENFRKETGEWLDANAPEFAKKPYKDSDEICWGGAHWEFAEPGEKQWLERMAEKGWTAPQWPKKYGGGGLSKEEDKILSQEMRKRRLRPPLIGFGLSMIGPLLLQEGSEELCEEHLPKIVRGEIRWCQGYSEPGSGSDLASLRTRADRDGDDYSRADRSGCHQAYRNQLPPHEHDEPGGGGQAHPADQRLFAFL